MWFIGVEVEQETRAPPPKKNPGSAPAVWERDCKERNVQSMTQDVTDQKKKRKKPKKSTIKCVSWSRSRRCCLLNRIVMFRISEPYTLQDYCLLFFTDYHRLLSIFVNRSLPCEQRSLTTRQKWEKGESLSPFSHYCLVRPLLAGKSITIDKLFFLRDFDFYRFPVSIDNNQRIKSIISHNFWYRFLSINYA